MDAQTQKRIEAPLGRIPSGLFVLTAAHAGERAGMLASWVQQAAFEPPTITVAVGHGRAVLPLIHESGRLGLCQLASGSRTILRRFAGRSGAWADPFEGLELLPERSVPLLAGAMAYLECAVTRAVADVGDHEVLFAEVVDGDLLGGEPDVRVRPSGFKY